MNYVTRPQVEDKIPPPVLLDALDDDGDGKEDVGRFDSIVATASAEVDGYLAGVVKLPFLGTIPSKVSAASLAFVCETIYQRRGVQEEKNPFQTVAKFWREHLQKVGNRDLPFDAAATQAFSPGAAITESISLDVQST